MSYVDSKYYIDIFEGEPVNDADFPSLCTRAEELIEEMTMYLVTPVIFQAMPEQVKEKIKMAVCAQIEYMNANGGSDLDNGIGIQSASLGKFSYTRSTESSSTYSGQAIYAPRAQRLLMGTGLLYRGGGRY